MLDFLHRYVFQFFFCLQKFPFSYFNNFLKDCLIGSHSCILLDFLICQSSSKIQSLTISGKYIDSLPSSLFAFLFYYQFFLRNLPIFSKFYIVSASVFYARYCTGLNSFPSIGIDMDELSFVYFYIKTRSSSTLLNVLLYLSISHLLKPSVTASKSLMTFIIYQTNPIYICISYGQFLSRIKSKTLISSIIFVLSFCITQ